VTPTLHRLLLLALGGVLLGGPPIAGSISADRPNVLLISIDTLRADRLGSYGYTAARTPVLDALAAKGVLFTDATSHAPLTLPAHVAMLTARYPGAYGIRVNGMGSVPASATTIAERFKGLGYRTGAVVASAVLARGYGLDQGFDDYDDQIVVSTSETLSTAELQRPADAVTTAAKGWLDPRDANPWFLWVHYYDPHLPYAAPAKYRAAAPDRPYDAEIAFTDAEIGRLLAGVDRARTIVVVTGDHGEALGEHGEPDHGFFLYDSTLRVPLIVSGPNLKPRRVAEQVRHVDLAPTLVQLAGGQAQSGDDGQSLVGLLNGESRREVPVSLAESWYPRYHFGWSELKSIRVGEWKYIAAPKPELYDLRTDKAEARNVAAERGAVAGRLAQDLSRIAGRFEQRAVATEQPDPAAVQRLQALGYLGSFAVVSSGSAQENPLDRVGDYRKYRDLFNRALSLLGRAQPAEAAAVLQQLVKLNVRAFEAHLYLGNAYAALKKPREALGEYDAAALLNPSVATPHIEAAKLLSTANDHPAAILRGRKAIEIAPGSDYANYTLGIVYRRAERWPEAADALLRAVELNPGNVRARAALGAAAMRTGRIDVASTQYNELIRRSYDVAPSHFNLGIIAASRKDTAEAARRFKLALQADPNFKPARDALAKIK
jgi:choline-sulfatase